MKWKRSMFFVVAVVLIVASFALPPLLLRASVSQMTQTPALLDASADSLAASDNLIEKLASFNDPYMTSVQLGLQTEPDTVAQALREELQTLHVCGALSMELFDLFYTASFEGIYVDRICMIQPELQLVFEVYTVHFLGSNAMALLDVSSGKVLQLSCSTGWESLLAREYGDGLGTEELAGWAEYYGLTLGGVSYTTVGLDALGRRENPYAEYRMTVLKEGLLTDSGGAGIHFGLTYEFRDNMVESYIWGPSA